MAGAMVSSGSTGRVALVTGAASGIGRATAQRLAKSGVRVVLADRSEDVAKVAESIRGGGAAALALRMDVTSEAEWAAGMERLLREWGRLDLCVNSAGIAWASPVLDLPLSDWKRVLSTNLDSVFLGTRHAMAAMKDGGGGGCIINIASAAGLKAVAGNAAYGTSKAAIHFFTRVAALEGQPWKIRVNSISPGAVATPMWAATPFWPTEAATAGGVEEALKVLVRDHGFAEPEAVAAAVEYLAGEDARHITGADLPLDSGFAIS